MDVVLLLIFLASIVFTRLIFSKKPKTKLPPTPLPLPLVGHLHLLSPHMHQSLHSLSLKHGPIIYLRIGSVPCVVVSSPDLIKQIFTVHDITFSHRKHTSAIDYLTYNNSSFAFAPYGPYWKFIKKLSTVELLGPRTLSQFLPIRKRELNCLLNLIYEKCKNNEKVNVTEELLKMTSNVMSQMMFSIRCSGTDGEANDVRRLVREVTEIFGEFNLSDIIWVFKNVDLQGFRKRFEDIHRRYDALLERIIKDRQVVRKMKRSGGGDVDKVDEEVKDFLDMLLDIYENVASEIQITRDQIKALILDFLTAATDTTAMAVEWSITELINHPEALQKAQNEIDQVIGKSRLVEESDIAQLPYLQAIIKETFRLHPPIPMLARKSVTETTVGNYTVPEGSILFVNLWSMGRNPKLWNDPMEFRPERFLDGKEDIDIKGLHYQLLPFGSGRRGCPGISLAMRELPTTLAALIQCFQWKLEAGQAVDMSERPGLTAPRAHDFLCLPVPRFQHPFFA